MEPNGLNRGVDNGSDKGDSGVEESITSGKPEACVTLLVIKCYLLP